MIRKMPPFLLLLALLLLFPLVAGAQEPAVESDEVATTVSSTGNAYALVVAIDDYPYWWKKRQIGIRNGEKISEILGKNGFAVTKLYNQAATTDKIMEQVKELSKKCGDDGYFVFYYSGHGFTSNYSLANYIVPYPQHFADGTEYISQYDLMAQIKKGAKEENVLLFLDQSLPKESMEPFMTHEISVEGYGLDKQRYHLYTETEDGDKKMAALFVNMLEKGMDANQGSGAGAVFTGMSSIVEEKVTSLGSDPNVGATMMTFTEEEVKVYAKKLPAAKPRARVEEYREPRDQFDEMMMERIEQKMEKIQEKIEELDKGPMGGRGPLPFP